MRFPSACKVGVLSFCLFCMRFACVCLLFSLAVLAPLLGTPPLLLDDKHSTTRARPQTLPLTVPLLPPPSAHAHTGFARTSPAHTISRNQVLQQHQRTIRSRKAAARQDVGDDPRLLRPFCPDGHGGRHPEWSGRGYIGKTATCLKTTQTSSSPTSLDTTKKHFCSGWSTGLASSLGRRRSTLRPRCTTEPSTQGSIS